MADVTTEILLRDSYIGQVATNCHVARNFYSVNKQSMSRNAHRARDRIKRLKLVYANWYMTFADPVTETSPGGDATVTASIDYNGTLYQALFSGAASVVIPDGGSVVSDWINVDIPCGATFWDRVFYQNAAGILYNTRQFAGRSKATFGVSGVVDQTMSGTVAATASGQGYQPVAIIAETRKGSVFLLFDSHGAGEGDTADISDDLGIAARTLGREFGYINAGSPGDRAQRFLTNGTKRAALAAYCSHVFCDLGTNDFFLGNRSSAQLQADIVAIRAMFSSKPFIVSTILPQTTSTDSWATPSNQTVKAQEASRTNYNGVLRGGTMETLTDVIDFADYVEVNSSGVLTRNGGFWPAGGTADGVHMNQASYIGFRDKGVIPLGFFR